MLEFEKNYMFLSYIKNMFPKTYQNITTVSSLVTSLDQKSEKHRESPPSQVVPSNFDIWEMKPWSKKRLRVPDFTYHGFAKGKRLCLI